MARGMLVPGLALALLAGGCSSDEPAGGGAAGSSSLSGEVSCGDDPRVDHFSARLAKDGARGALTFELLASDPAPPAKGDNALTLRVVDAADEPADVSLDVQLSMPDHGHGSPVVPKISHELGRFSIAPLNLFMAGVWQIDLQAKGREGDDETPLDEVSFFFCIEG